MFRKLFPLTLGGLGIGTTEFVMMGILPNIAETLQISIPKAGNLISGYALGVVIGGPLLVSLMRKLDYKISLILLGMLFLVFNGLCALSDNYYTLLCLRFFSGLPHGAFFGIGSVVAANSVPADKQARAVSLMFLGLTAANLLTVPFGTYLAIKFTWSYTFYMVALIGLVTVIAIIFFLPPTGKEITPKKTKSVPLLQKREALLILSMTAVGTAGTFAWISYIAPLMTNVAQVEQSFIPQIMILIGVGMVVGNLTGGILSDRLKPARACLILLFAISVAFLTTYFLATLPHLLLITTFITACLSMAIATPIQLLIMAHAASSKSVAAASTQAAFNVANSIGAFLGGIPLTLGFGFRSPQLVACGLALCGVLIAYKLYRSETKET